MSCLYHSIKDIITKIMYNNRISDYDVTKGTTLDKLLNNSSLKLRKIRTITLIWEEGNFKPPPPPPTGFPLITQKR